MIQATAILVCVGLLSGAAMAQSVMPVQEVVDDTYIQGFPDGGARIAVFEAGQGFREELFSLDKAGVFDTLQPGQPPLSQADIIIARVDDWAEAAAVYTDTPLNDLAATVGDLPEEQSVHIGQVALFGGLDVLVFTVLNESEGEGVHARCMARLVIDTLYSVSGSGFDLVACSRELN